VTSHLRADDYEVHNIVRHGDAVRIVREWHYSKSAPNTSTYRHGLFPAGLMTELVGVALWIPPTKSAAVSLVGDGWQSVLSLSRLVVAPWLPTNAASFLLGRSMRRIDRVRWPFFVTYADTNQGHTGAIYRATNWVCDGPVAAGDVWELPDGSLCGRKRGGRNLTAEQLRALGAIRRPAAPKIRFTHTLKQHKEHPCPR
jgi:hypothetical protein